MKLAAKTNHAMASQNLIKRICYPDIYGFSTAATRYTMELKLSITCCKLLARTVGGVATMK